MSGPTARRSLLGRAPTPFVNREAILAAVETFHRNLAATDSGVVVLHGLGGMGKSRVASEIATRLPPRCPVVKLDFFLPQLRGFDTGLLTLRSGLVPTLGRAAFPVFDIAFAHYWQLTHPAASRADSQVPFLEESEILSDMAGAFAQVPLIGGLVATAKLGARLREFARSRRILQDPMLQEVLSLSLSDVARTLPEVFGYDLSRVAKPDRPLLVVDTVEALLGEAALVDGSSPGEWLEGLIGSTQGVTWLLLSRDAMGWKSGLLPSSGGRLQVLEIAVGPLSEQHVEELLVRAGVETAAAGQSVYESSQGYPFFIEVWLDGLNLGNGLEQSAQPEAGVDHERLVRRLLGHMDAGDQQALVLLSALEMFDDDWADAVVSYAGLPRSNGLLDRLAIRTLCRPAGERRLAIDPVVADKLRSQLAHVAPPGYEHFLAEHAANRLIPFQTEPIEAHDQWLVLEAVRLAMRVDECSEHLIGGCLALAETRSLGAAELGLRSLLAASPNTGAAYWIAVTALARIVRRRGGLAHAEELLAGRHFAVSIQPYLELELAEIRREVGKPEQAATLYRRVLDLPSTGPEQRVLAALALVDRHVVLGRFQRALAELEHQGSAIGSDPRLAGLHVRQKGQALRAAGAPEDDALECFSAAMTHFMSLGDDYNRGRCLTDIADLLSAEHPGAAVDAADEAIAIHREFGTAVELGKTITYLAVASHRLGDHGRARSLLDEADDILEVVGYRSGLDRVLVARSAIDLEEGDRAAAAAGARAAVRSVETRDSHRQINLLGRVLIRSAGLETPDESDQLSRLVSEIEWLGSSQLGSFGVPLRYFWLLGLAGNE